MTKELDWQPMFELRKTDEGIDGWDAKTWVVAKFTSYEKAKEYLSKGSYTYQIGNSYYHSKPECRNTMGAISYDICKVEIKIPVDPDWRD